MDPIKFIYVTTDFYALHCYPNAPDEVYFLRNMHRHKFFVTCKIQVFHNDRDLEFIMVKNRINDFIKNNLLERTDISVSCETISEFLFDWIKTTYGNNRKVFVGVSEDNENGSEITDIYTA